MSLKVKLDLEDEDTFVIDIPLFTTAQEAVKDIQLDESVVKVNVIKDSQEDQ